MARHGVGWGLAAAVSALLFSAVPVAATAPSGATVTGHVYAPDGTPVAGAEVIASRGQSRDHPAIIAFSASDGSFVLTGLEAYTYAVEAGATDYGPVEQPSEFTVSASLGDLTHDIHLQPLSAATVPDPPEVVYVTPGTDTIDFTAIVWGTGFQGWHSFVPQGGNPVTRTTATIGPGDITCTQTSRYQWRATGLKPDTEYVITVVAYNQVGASAPAETTVRTLPEVTPPSAPLKVTDINVTRTLAGRPIVRFKAPQTSVISDYELHYLVGTTWRVYAHRPSSAPVLTVTGLAPQKSYKAYIVPVAKQGTVARSPVFTLTTGPGRR